jgi:hypothetical protein
MRKYFKIKIEIILNELSFRIWYEMAGYQIEGSSKEKLTH